MELRLWILKQLQLFPELQSQAEFAFEILDWFSEKLECDFDYLLHPDEFEWTEEMDKISKRLIRNMENRMIEEVNASSWTKSNYNRR